MFDRHQAEIIVMQFRGHSLPVHQSMSVPWDFLPCPISLAKHAYAISSHNCHWNVSLPSGASPWNSKFGQVEGQNTTVAAGAELVAAGICWYRKVIDGAGVVVAAALKWSPV